jgi:tetratricopeptide (TPR) repeat protein
MTDTSAPADASGSLTEEESTATTTPTPTPSARPGKAGRTDYDQWHKLTNSLVEDVEKEEKEETEAQKLALGLDGKYAASQAEAEERQKAKSVKQAKKALDGYLKRENALKTEFIGTLGPVPDRVNGAVPKVSEAPYEETKLEPQMFRVVRDNLDAGKRVVSVSDTSGRSHKDTIVLTQDLSLLESKMKANAMSDKIKPKEFPDDAENKVEENPAEAEHRTVFGVIKVFLSNVHNCTVLVKCKIISGTMEMSHCSNVLVRIEKEATVATMQVDLCQDIAIEFRDAPSGKNTNLPGQAKVYWGEDKEDRIFHAGVQRMRVAILRDEYIETERVCDFETDGAKMIGNATEREFQFVTSVVEGEITTEAVVRAGATTGENVRAMTQRELEAERENREKAAKYAVGMAENMIKFKEKGKEVTKGEPAVVADVKKVEEVEEEIEEIYASMSKEEIDSVVKECDKNKQRGNEAFGAGEYAQAILLYSLALDKAHELPDADAIRSVTTSDSVTTSTNRAIKQLFPRDVTLANRAACFLKLGQHEKAEADAKLALSLNPDNVKAIFRCGLSLHAQAKYQEALPWLARAQKIEPKNKQISQAITFAEMRLTQEMRKRMEG